MAIFETWLKSDLKKQLRVVQLSGNLFSEDDDGNLIGVEVTDNGLPVTFGGTSSVHGYIIRADGYTVVTTGTLSGNKASIVLPASAYAVVGQVSIVIKVDDMTVGACVCYVYKTTTDVIVDPGSVVPSIAELLAKIGACEAATLAASSAASVAISAASSVNSVIQAANSAISSAVEATSCAISAAAMITDMTVEASTLPPMTPPTATISDVDGHKHIAFGIPEGLAGCIEETDNTEAEVMSFSDGANNLPMEVTVAINPVQDLHGYANPWAGGAGKNLLPCLLSSIKSNNTGGTWNEDTYSLYGIDFKFSTQDGYVTSVEASGTATANATVRVYADSTGIPAESYIANGCPDGGTSGTYYMRLYNANSSSGGTAKFDYGNGVSVDDTYTIKRINVSVDNGNTVSGLVFKPMVRLSTETDATFEPYENICPISGWDSVQITRTNNMLDDTLQTFVKGKYIAHETGEIGSASGYWYTDNYISLIPGIYTVKCDKTATQSRGMFAIFYNSNKEYLSGVEIAQASSSTGNMQGTFTVPNNAVFTRFTVSAHTEGSLIIQNGNEITITGTTNVYPISLPTTTYGGTLTINKDGSGTLVVDKAIANVSDFTWTYNSNGYLYATVSDIKRATSGVIPDIISNMYVADVPASVSSASGKNGTMTIGVSNSRILVRDDRYTTSEAFVESGAYFIYPLDSAEEITFTVQQIRSILGENNIWANSGNVLNVVYSADTKMYIDNLFNSILPATGVSF